MLKNFSSDLSLCLVNRKERFRHECKRVRGNKSNVNELSEKGKTHNYFTKVLVPAGEVEMPRVLLVPLWCFGALVLWHFGALVLWCFGALVHHTSSWGPAAAGAEVSWCRFAELSWCQLG